MNLKLKIAGGTAALAAVLGGGAAVAATQLSPSEESDAIVADAAKQLGVSADEPTGNLDSTTGSEIVEILAALAADRGTTVIVATHDAGLAGRSQRRLGIRDGRLAAPAVAAANS